MAPVSRDQGRIEEPDGENLPNRFRGLVLNAPLAARQKQPSYGGSGAGLMYDPKRDLAWLVNPGWEVQVLRLDPSTARFIDKPTASPSP